MVTPVKTLALVLAVVLGSTAAAGPPRVPLRTISWSKLKAEGKLAAGEIVAPQPGESFEILRVENATDRVRTFAVAVVDSPGIRQSSWVLTGRVQCVGVEGRAYLELLNRFPDGEVHFAQTLARAGPMQWLEKTSAWRDFALPFHAFKKHRPSQLVVNVVLPRRGLVELGPLSLYEGGAAVQALSGAR